MVDAEKLDACMEQNTARADACRISQLGLKMFMQAGEEAFSDFCSQVESLLSNRYHVPGDSCAACTSSAEKDDRRIYGLCESEFFHPKKVCASCRSAFVKFSRLCEVCWVKEYRARTHTIASKPNQVIAHQTTPPWLQSVKDWIMQGQLATSNANDMVLLNNAVTIPLLSGSHDGLCVSVIKRHHFRYNDMFYYPCDVLVSAEIIRMQKPLDQTGG